jgi:hypothetical protein
MAPVAPPCANTIPEKTITKRLDAISLQNDLILSSNQVRRCP